MRYATKEERESVNRYVESISHPTGINFFGKLKKIPESIQVGVKAQQRLDRLDMILPTGPLYGTITDLADRENDISYTYIYEICGINDKNSENKKHISVYIPYGLFNYGHYTCIRWAKSYKDHHFILNGSFSKNCENYKFINNGGLYTLENKPIIKNSLFTYSTDKNSTFYIKKGKPKEKTIQIDLKNLKSEKTKKSKFIAIYDEDNDTIIETYIAISCDWYNEVFDNHPYLLYRNNGKYYIMEVY